MNDNTLVVMNKNEALLQDVQNVINDCNFNFVSIKEEPVGEINNESDAMCFESTERQYEFSPEGIRKVHDAGPLVCIFRILVTMLFCLCVRTIKPRLVNVKWIKL
jgi:hypothetical protein